MATGIQRLVRRALLAKLKGDAGLIALVPSASIHPAGEPSWPFIRLDAPVTRRLKATGLNGGVGSFDIHAFARDREVAGSVVETGEDHAGRIGGAIEAALADNRLALEGGGEVRITVDDMRLLTDDDPGAWHYFAQVNFRVLAA
ncbi:DUF3168 domain-containing protein [Novosphingobium sp.]|uniref:DUF3168 domain-containing protein n=1 Tax=Novosphingobium sp. TaxID=1874826 RepID=UPI00286E90E5|nr:DUF3168 domain-containing protein [Novosphingobium sp.]